MVTQPTVNNTKTHNEVNELSYKEYSLSIVILASRKSQNELPYKEY